MGNKILSNASQFPKRYFGLHFLPGVAEYQTKGSEPYRVFVNEQTIREMSPTFEGKPVYVKHVDEVNVQDLGKGNEDGWVVKSFYNSADGKTWVEFLVTSDKGHEAISSGWKLSNAYLPTSFAQGGLWNGVEYAKEVTSGEFEHLAIVPNPRYEESVIMTPEDFKEYNLKKENELKRLTNSNNKGADGMFKLFKKTKVENSSEFENMVVTLPKSGKELTITQLVNDMDSMEQKKNEEKERAPMCNEEHMVDMGDESKMSVKEMKDAYNSMKQELSDLKKPKEEEEEKKNEEPKKEEKKNEEKKAAAVVEEKKNEEKKPEEEKKANSHFESLKNAQAASLQKVTVVDLSSDKVARGKSRYGS